MTRTKTPHKNTNPDKRLKFEIIIQISTKSHREFNPKLSLYRNLYVYYAVSALHTYIRVDLTSFY